MKLLLPLILILLVSLRVTAQDSSPPDMPPPPTVGKDSPPLPAPDKDKVPPVKDLVSTKGTEAGVNCNCVTEAQFSQLKTKLEHIEAALDKLPKTQKPADIDKPDQIAKNDKKEIPPIKKPSRLKAREKDEEDDSEDDDDLIPRRRSGNADMSQIMALMALSSQQQNQGFMGQNMSMMGGYSMMGNYGMSSNAMMMNSSPLLMGGTNSMMYGGFGGSNMMYGASNLNSAFPSMYNMNPMGATALMSPLSSQVPSYLPYSSGYGMPSFANSSIFPNSLGGSISFGGSLGVTGLGR